MGLFEQLKNWANLDKSVKQSVIDQNDAALYDLGGLFINQMKQGFEENPDASITMVAANLLQMIHDGEFGDDMDPERMLAFAVAGLALYVKGRVD